jgi:hypothetical protein
LHNLTRLHCPLLHHLTTLRLVCSVLSVVGLHFGRVHLTKLSLLVHRLTDRRHTSTTACYTEVLPRHTAKGTLPNHLGYSLHLLLRLRLLEL